MVTLRTGEPVVDALMGVYNPHQQRTNWIRVSTMPLGYEGADIAEVYARFVLLDDETAERLRAEASAS